RWTPPPAPTLKWWDSKTTARRAGALVAAFARDTATPFVAAWRQHCYRLALDCLADARRGAGAARLRAVALNYEDLLQIAARRLRLGHHRVLAPLPAPRDAPAAGLRPPRPGARRRGSPAHRGPRARHPRVRRQGRRRRDRRRDHRPVHPKRGRGRPAAVGGLP